MTKYVMYNYKVYKALDNQGYFANEITTWYNNTYVFCILMYFIKRYQCCNIWHITGSIFGSNIKFSSKIQKELKKFGLKIRSLGKCNTIDGNAFYEYIITLTDEKYTNKEYLNTLQSLFKLEGIV